MAKKRVVSSDGDLQALGRERARKHAEIVHFYAQQWENHSHNGQLLENIRICPPKYTGDKWLIVLKVWKGDEQCVGFHRGSTLLGSLSGALVALQQGKVQLRPDAYAKRFGGE